MGKVIAYAVHEWIQCVMIEILDPEIRKMAVSAQYTHITISCNRKRVGPQFSNELLKYGQVIPVIGEPEMVIEGTVGAFARDTNIYMNREAIPKAHSGGKGEERKWKEGEREK